MRRSLSRFAVVCLLAGPAAWAIPPPAVCAQGPPAGRTPAERPVAGERPAAGPRGETPAADPRGEEGARTEGAAPADISITGRVTAESLVFRKVPNPRVEFTGRPRRDTAWETERTNLPEQVRPGVTYRDIGITLRITSVFADIERIVAEALGEVPAADPEPVGPRPQGAPQTPAPGGASEQPPVASTRRPPAGAVTSRASARARRRAARRGGRGL